MASPRRFVSEEEGLEVGIERDESRRAVQFSGDRVADGGRQEGPEEARESGDMPLTCVTFGLLGEGRRRPDRALEDGWTHDSLTHSGSESDLNRFGSRMKNSWAGGSKRAPTVRAYGEYPMRLPLMTRSDKEVRWWK